MKKSFLFMCVFLSGLVVGHAQGVNFVEDLSWVDIFQKAKSENKYVFIDCYATWCGPCRIMDKSVFALDSIGIFMNDRFVSAKMQMDTTSADNDRTRGWYAAARDIAQKYHIGAYPAYIFFAPDGHIVHKDVGVKESSDFLEMARAAMDVSKQYYTLLASFRERKLSFRLMPGLIAIATRIRQDSIAKRVSQTYVHYYLEKLPDKVLWSVENIRFLNMFPEWLNYKDRLFRLYFLKQRDIDSIMGNSGYSSQLIKHVIYRDIIKGGIDHAISTKSRPNWVGIKKRIAKSFNQRYADESVLTGKVEYFRIKKQWDRYVTCFILQQEKDGIDHWDKSVLHEFVLNNNAFEVFRYSNRKAELKKALSWVDRALAMAEHTDPEEMDTKANILYKMGDRKRGIALEQECYVLMPGNKEISQNYERMKSDLPTWSIE